MSALSELLDGAVREDAMRLGGAGFATDRYGAVRGRVARRRAARSAGVGGASVLGIGVLAVGGAQVPWGSFVEGASPVGSASVICTTTTPDAVASQAPAVPPGATFVALEEATGDVVFLGWPLPGGKSTVWDRNGESLALSATAESSIYTFPSGARVSLMDQFQGSGAESFDPAAVRITTVDGYLKSVTPTAAPDPITTCVTATPQPSESGSPSESASPSPSVSASPAVVDEFGALRSPFQCGAELVEPEHGTDEVAIGDIRWVSAQEAKDGILATYEGAEESVQLNVSGDDVPIAKLQFAPGVLRNGTTSWDLADPANGDYGTISGAGVDEDSGVVVGAQYVLVSGGEIVATGLPFGPGAQAQWILPSDLPTQNAGAEVYLLSAAGGLAACEGVADSQLAEAQLVAVAGMMKKVDGAETGPFYAWKAVPGQP